MNTISPLYHLLFLPEFNCDFRNHNKYDTLPDFGQAQLASLHSLCSDLFLQEVELESLYYFLVACTRPFLSRYGYFVTVESLRQSSLF